MSDAQVPPPGPQQVMVVGNGLATAGFVLGLLGLLGSWIPVLNIFAAVLGVLGLILAAVGWAKSKRVHRGKGLAIAGVILGVLSVLFTILVNTAFVKAVDDATKTTVHSAGGAGSSREHPAPLGTKVTHGDWTVVVESTGVVKQDSLGKAAESGKVLLQVHLVATYSGSDQQGDMPWVSVDYVGADGSTVKSSDTFLVADHEFSSMDKVYPGKSTSGDELLQVPANWQSGVLAVSPAIAADDVFITVK